MNMNEILSPLLSPNLNPIPRGSLPCRFQKQNRLSAVLLLLVVLSSTTSTTTAKQQPEGRRLLRSSSSSSTTPTVSTKIVGGQPAEVPVPFFVQWQDRGCGGSLIHDDIMLTAAHCYIGTADQVANPMERTVHIGGTQLNVAPVTRTMTRQIPHPQFELIDVSDAYQETTLEYDFMLVKLNQSALLQQDDNNEVPQVQPIAVNTNPDWPLPGDALTVMGFGVEHPTAWDLSERLQQVQVTALANDECVDLYNDTLDVFVDVMFCAAEPGKDSCQGDSGGPIVYAGDANNPPLQVGVVSFGHSCGAEDFPGVYSRLSAVQSWIQETICQWTCHNLPDYCETDYPDIEPHPCATDPSGRPTGPLDLQFQIVFDQYPSEQAILVEHVETATELLFRPYGYYNQSLPDADTENEDETETQAETVEPQTSIPIPVQTSKQARQPPPPLVKTFDFIQQPAGTFRISVGDLGRDGICCKYGAGNLTLFLIDRSTDSDNPTKTILWSNNGQFGSKLETEIELDQDGSVIRQNTATTANGSQQEAGEEEEEDTDSTNDEGESDNGDANEGDNNNGNNDIGLGSGSDNQDDEEEDEDSEGDGNGEQDDTSTWSPEDGVLPSPGEFFDLVLVGENDEQEEEATSSPTSSSSELFEVKEERIGQWPNHPSYDIINPP